MRIESKTAFVAALAALAQFAVPAAEGPRVPDYLRKAVVYQLSLRTFTRDGNFRAAAEMLGHVRSAGVDIVYLLPFVEMDRDMDETGWSPRQKASGFHTPKNPYRISDYGKIDPEYGHDADFKAFSERAHELGMKVFMDIVYMHCGPNNVIKDAVPDAFQRNPDGSVHVTSFKFPFLNFESRAARKYLIDSMLKWVSLGCDGFRCDMADYVPIDFWEEAAAACRAVKPGFGMINEGWRASSLERAFDACYALPWSYMIRDELVRSGFNKGFVNAFKCTDKPFPERMDYIRSYESTLPEGSLTLCFLDNHDTANDDGEDRFDRRLPVEAGNAAFVLTFLHRGIPMLYNGNEIADNSLSTFFAPVEDVGRARKTVDWARALQPAGRSRLECVRALSRLRHEMPVFVDGSQEWVPGGEAKGVVAFVRRLGGTSVFVAANLKGVAAEFPTGGIRPAPGAKPLFSHDGELRADGACRLGPWGFFVVPVQSLNH